MGVRLVDRLVKQLRTAAHHARNKQELKKRQTKHAEARVVMDITESDKNKVWAFCSGHASNDFRGNPKWLFIYMNKYRPDITTYWLCEDDEVLAQVRGMGYRAYKLHTLQAERAINLTGVLVSEQVKSYIPQGLEHAKYLNLWHGVGGVKAVEKAQTGGALGMELAKKYIGKNEYYHNYELYLATSPFIEGIARDQLGISEDRMIRAAYPRNVYQAQYERVETFDHNLIKRKGLPADTRIVAYTPTHRNNAESELFAEAFPDMDELIRVCKENHLLMIFKMHPMLESEIGFRMAREAYADCPWLYFWDNRDDFYEILDKIDLCIMDFSSIFTDFLSAGVKHFIRYIFDIDPETLDFPMGYDEVTLGRKCKTFAELLEGLAHYREDDLTVDIQRIHELYWQYANGNDMETIVQATLDFCPKHETLPTLYSFDIFDTLISRKVLEPSGIFYKVREQMRRSSMGFPADLIDNYVSVRRACEQNCRTYYNRSKTERDDERCEIQFREIFDCMKKVYPLTEPQILQLMQWELDAELDDSIPLSAQIDYVKELKARGEEVVLISDMYLPKEFITQLLVKADPLLGELPLFLSSEYGYQKSHKALYLEVYKHYAPYDFGRWIHHGDNRHSDVKVPASLDIRTVPIDVPVFNELEQALVETVGTYDAFLVAANMARFRTAHPMAREQFVYSYVSLLFVPYVYWCVHDAIARGDEILYFISRDGHHLKRIADTIIAREGLSIETKYIYASRRTWRIPSFIDHIDVGFWGQGYGNFAKVNSFAKLLKAMNMDEPTFRRLFPEFAELNDSTVFSLPELQRIVNILKVSPKFLNYILGVAAEERVSVCGYLKQEMSLNRPFSIVEYWGRGYTQENFTRLWQQVVGQDVPSVFYYSRSTLPPDEYNIRKNFTLNPSEQQFIEAIFANMPYKSIEKYDLIDGKWTPEIKPIDCDEALFEAMQTWLPAFAEAYCALPFTDRDAIGRCLIDFAITFYNQNQDWQIFREILAPAKDSVELYGKKIEYAKELTDADIDDIASGKVNRNKATKSLTMSLLRATPAVRERYRRLFQLEPGEDFAGGTKLSAAELTRSAKFAEAKAAYERQIAALRAAYLTACEQTVVENRVLLVCRDVKEYPIGFRRIGERLGHQSLYSVEVLETDAYDDMTALANKIATARFILTEKPLPLLANLPLRGDTKLVMLGEPAVFFQPMGLLRSPKIRAERELFHLQQKLDISCLMVASEAMVPVYREVYHVNEATDYSVKGNCLTDVYFDPDFAVAAKEKLLRAFPEAKDKKVICYIPAHRYRNKRSQYAELLDMQLMQRELGDEYVVILHKQPETARLICNVLDIPGFSKDLTGKLSAREQFAAADIIVGDYRNVTLEAPLLRKPLYLTCWDAKAGRYNSRQLFDYEEFCRGLEVADTQDLITKLRADNFDLRVTDAYVEKYLTYCDGRSADRLFDYLMQNALPQG